MSAITQSYKIDMTSGAVPLRIKVSQYDAGIRQLTFWLYNLGTKLTSSQLSSLTAYVQGTKEDQKGFEYECTAGFSSEGCYVDVDITEQMTACAGDVVCELVLTAEDVRIGSTNFVLEVEKAALGADTDISETELPDIIDAGRRYAAAAEEAAERAEEAAASTSAGAAIGNVTGVDNSTVDTNIDLGRDLVEGDRILLYVGNKITEPRNVITYKNGTAVTTSFGMLILPGFYISGLVMLEYQEDVMPDTYKWARVWMDEAVTYTAGTGISINGTTIYNSLPMRGDAFEEYEITTAVDDGDLGGFSDLVDYLLIRFKANAVPDNEDHYTCILGHSTPVAIRKAGILKDAAGSYFGDDIAAGTTLLCKADDGGDGTSENPIIVTVLAVLGVGGSGATSLAELTDTSISSPTNGQVLTYNGTSGKWGNNTNFEVDASGNVTAGGNVTDGAGNKLSEAIQWDAAKTSVKKNYMPMTLAGIKAENTSGSWNNNDYTLNNVTFALQTDDDGNVTGIKVNGTASATTVFYVTAYGKFLSANTNYTINGCTGGSSETYKVDISVSTGPLATSYDGDGDNTPFTVANNADYRVRIVVYSGVNLSNKLFYPMIRLSTVTDSTFAPYILDNVELASSKTDNTVVGPVESGTTASRAYAVGEHFIKNDKFCTCISAIASGATLTQGTNYVEGTIADNLYKRVNYSATEHVVGTWIDGSTLYEKTISCGQLPNSGPKYVDTGYTNNIKIVNIEMIAFNTDWMIYLPSVNPGSSNNNDDITVLHRRTYNAADSSMSYKLVILTGTDRSDYTESYCTIRYTKS